MKILTEEFRPDLSIDRMYKWARTNKIELYEHREVSAQMVFDWIAIAAKRKGMTQGELYNAIMDFSHD